MVWKASEKSDSHVAELGFGELDPEYRGTREIPWKMGGPPSKPKYYPVTIEKSTVKERWTPGRGVKENLKPCAYKHRDSWSTGHRRVFGRRSASE